MCKNVNSWDSYKKELLRVPGDLLSSLYHSLQAFAVQSRSAAAPDCDTAGQNALNNAVVEVAEDLRRHAKLPQPPQEKDFEKTD